MKLVWDALSIEAGRPSGVRRRLLALAPRLARTVPVCVISADVWSPAELQLLRGCEVRTVQQVKHSLWNRLVRGEKLLRQHGAFEPGTVLLQDAQPWSSHPRLIGTVHDLRHWRGGLGGLAARTLLRRSFRRAAALACVSGTVAEGLRRAVPELQQRSVVVPNGVEPCACKASPAAKDTPLLLWVGHLEARKDVSVAIAVAEALARSGRALRFMCVGRGAQPIEAALQAASQPCVHRAEVRRQASDDEMLTLWHEAAVVLCPSRLEGFGLVPLEAMAHAACVVASDIAAHREVLGEAALFAPVGDVAAFARAVERVLDDAQVRERLTHAGPKRAALWTWDAAAEALLAAAHRHTNK